MTTLREILTAVKDLMATEPDIESAQTLETMTEGMNTLPAVQVYVEDFDTSAGSQTDRHTFKAGVRQTDITIHIDVYVQMRSNIGLDMAAVIDLVDKIIPLLEAQKEKPYFGIDGIKAFHWNAQRVTFLYGETSVGYAGMRFFLKIRIF